MTMSCYKATARKLIVKKAIDREASEAEEHATCSVVDQGATQMRQESRSSAHCNPTSPFLPGLFHEFFSLVGRKKEANKILRSKVFQPGAYRPLKQVPDSDRSCLTLGAGECTQ